VLLTDKALGGADTWATANPLAYAIRKISKEILCSEDFFVITGMQSVDGDTAQVPGQAAEELGISCLAYVTDCEYKDGGFVFNQIISGGNQKVRLKHRPAVITVAKNEYPPFATFYSTRKANTVKIIKWGTNDINAEVVGAKGSKTTVIRVFPPGKSSRKCKQVEDAFKLAKIIIDNYKASKNNSGDASTNQVNYVLPKNRTDKLDRNWEGLIKDMDSYSYLKESLVSHGIKDPSAIDDYMKKKLLDESDGRFHKRSFEDMLSGYSLFEPTYTGEVWVVAETQGETIYSATFELIGKARQLADCLESKVGVVLAGANIGDKAQQMIYYGADDVYLIENDLLERFDPISYRKAISDCILKYKPQIVLFAATPQGRMLAPMVSYKCSSGLTADCTGLEIRDNSRRGEVAVLFQTRPALGGNVMATICSKNSPMQMATARPGVMKSLEPDENRKGQVIEHAVDLSDNDISLEIISSDKGGSGARFDSEIIVSGGKGMQNRDDYDKLINDLCAALRISLDTSVEKGASRAAVEQEFAERIHQVGQTGTSVGPKIYIAVGISGAIQHMIGVANTETIIAINSDPNAPIFKQCDYYIVGTAEEVIPNLVNAIHSYE
jgi:electron transfer flavoprotein alpha subunit